MVGSLQTLLDGIIDYAGLFPPAKLSMADALRQFVAARQPQLVSNWMVQSFVCPAVRLGELEDHMADDFDAADPIVLSALGRKADDLAGVLSGLDDDLAAASMFCRRKHEVAVIRNFELALPDAAFANRGAFDGLLHELVDRFARQRWAAEQQDRLQVFIETPAAGNWPERIRFVTDLLAGNNADRAAVGYGLKLRTGGLEPAALPSTAFLAAAMAACHRRTLAWKATAGLHHPVRRRDPASDTIMHGFLNVAVADAMGLAAKADEATMASILEEEDGNAFQFESNGIRWGERRVPINDIADARWGSFVSFGSCSYEEPIADLEQLGLL